MKNSKIFEITSVLNLVFCLAFIILADIMNFKYNRDILSTILVFLGMVFFIIIVPFYWACLSVLRAYRSGYQLSKRNRTYGSIITILYKVLTIFLLIGSIDLVFKFSENGFGIDWMSLAAFILFWLSTITSIYLVISYWVIRKHINSLFAQTLSQIGLQGESETNQM
jgi:hypothetical protein